MSEDEQTTLQERSVDGRIWKGVEQLRPYLMRISDLRPTTGNPFKGQAHVGRLMASLERFGQTRPITVDSADGETIRAGHHVTLAAEELGWTHVAGIVAEFSDEGEALAYLLADNRLARVGDADTDIKQQLTMLDLVENLDGTGWDDRSVEALRVEAALPVKDPEQLPETASESAAAASAKAKAIKNQPPGKTVSFPMTPEQHSAFEEHQRLLRQAWSLTSTSDIIRRAMEEAYEREAAPVASEEAASPPSPEVGAASIPDDEPPL